MDGPDAAWYNGITELKGGIFLFTDKRSRRLVLAAHCLLNHNAISDGMADYPGTHEEVARLLLEEGVGILQLPCPELCCLGLDRGDPLGASRPVTVENTRIRREMERPEAAARLDALVEQVLLQAREYHRHGFSILGIVGVNRSPCCGVETTSENGRETAGRGVFLQRLLDALAAEGLYLPAVGVKSGPQATGRVAGLLRGRTPLEPDV